MSGAEALQLLPIMLVAAGGTLVMVAGSLGAPSRWLYGMTMASFLGALIAVFALRPPAPVDVTPLLRIDAFASLFMALLLAAAAVIAMVARPYLSARRRDGEAFWALLLFAGTGMAVLACSRHFAALFLGLETLTIALYGLLGYLRDDRRSLEAAAKYLVLAALASGLLLYGIALVYAATGTLQLRSAVDAAVDLITTGSGVESAWAAAGALLLLAGFAFKLALVPFHMWSPDVYQGSPLPVTALIATGSKGAVVAVAVRMLGVDTAAELLAPVLAALAAATMLGGNLLALLQDDLKRLLAYSSVAHLGYVLVALSAGGTLGGEAVVFYMVTYVVTTLGAFGAATLLSTSGADEADRLSDFRGLGRRRPGLAAVLAVMLLSLAGIPPTGGFLAKFAVLSAAIDAGRSGLALVMVLASGIGIYYYLRVLVVMYLQPATEGDEVVGATRPAGGNEGGGQRTPLPAAAATLTMAGLAALVIAIGVHPTPWLRAAAAAIAALQAL